MKPLSNSPSRDEVLAYLFEASDYGNLGLFVGAGFSKAVLNTPGNIIALSWGELLARCAYRLDVDLKGLLQEGASYPELASRLCTRHSAQYKVSFSDALLKLKFAIRDLTSWYPREKQRRQYGAYLESMSAAWIITTNYDPVIESVLTGRALSLGPNDPFSVPKDLIPIYHLHGTRSDPRGIIIAQEDYVALFRPAAYRQLRLAMTLKESTTLVLGYALGDVNVLTALDWSDSVFETSKPRFPKEVIQIVRKDDPRDAPYRGENQIIVMEYPELSSFFEEYAVVRKPLAEKADRNRRHRADLSKAFENPDKSLVSEFIDDPKFRSAVLEILTESSVYLVRSFESFLARCIEETWTRSIPDGAFGAYDDNLKMILDILEAFPVAVFPPSLFELVAYALNRLAYYVGGAHGKSFAAYATWQARKGKLEGGTVTELCQIAQIHGYANLLELLDSI